MSVAEGFPTVGVPVRYDSGTFTTTLPGALVGAGAGAFSGAGSFGGALTVGGAIVAAGSLTLGGTVLSSLTLKASNGETRFAWDSDYLVFGLGNPFVIQWASGNGWGGVGDAGIARNSGGVVEINSGTKGAFRDLYLRTLSASTDVTAAGNISAAGTIVSQSGPPYIAFA